MKGCENMQYILEESELKGLLLCKKYIQELYNSLSKNIENNPELKNNKGIMDNYKKYILFHFILLSQNNAFFFV